MSEQERYCVEPTRCNCHPETCACNPYTIYVGTGNDWRVFTSVYDKETATQIATALNAERDGLQETVAALTAERDAALARVRELAEQLKLRDEDMSTIRHLLASCSGYDDDIAADEWRETVKVIIDIGLRKHWKPFATEEAHDES